MIKHFVKEHLNIIILIAIFGISAAFVLPHLNFPFNDDWGYALLTKGFVENFSFTFFNWCDPTMIFMVWWGSLWSWMLGFSMTALHISTVILAIFALLSFYLILRQLGFDKNSGVTASLLLVLNPIFFFNSFTFMTDIPFVSITLLTLFFYLAFYQSGKIHFLILTSIFSIFAFLIRQIALSITIVLFLFELLRPTEIKPRKLTRVSFILLLPLLIDAIALTWRMSQPNIFIRSYHWPRPLWTLELIFFMLQYVSLFLLPFLLAWMVKLKNWKNLFSRIGVAIPFSMIVGCFGLLFVLGRTHPFLRNQFTAYGMFGVNEVLMGNRQEIFGKNFWIVLTVLSSLGLIVLGVFSINAVKKFILAMGSDRQGWRDVPSRMRTAIGSQPTVVFYLITIALLIGPVLLLGNCFDRYAIALIPGASIFFLQMTKNDNLSRPILYLSFALMFFFTMTITYDTIGWNKVKWREARALVESGVSPTDIDAGFDWCGWYANKPLQSVPPPEKATHFKSWYLIHRFWDCDNKYAISFSPRVGFETLKIVGYPRPFWLKQNQLYVLKRLE